MVIAIALSIAHCDALREGTVLNRLDVLHQFLQQRQKGMVGERQI